MTTITRQYPATFTTTFGLDSKLRRAQAATSKVSVYVALATVPVARAMRNRRA